MNTFSSEAAGLLKPVKVDQREISKKKLRPGEQTKFPVYVGPTRGVKVGV